MKCLSISNRAPLKWNWKMNNIVSYNKENLIMKEEMEKKKAILRD